MSNLRILRLTNVGNQVEESTDKSSFTFKIPEDLINLGRCLVEVESGYVQVTRQTVDANDDVDAIVGRIVPSNIPLLLIRSNIEQVGVDSFSSANPNIIATCLLQNTSISAANVFAGAGTGTGGITLNVAPITGEKTFLCNRLPTECLVEKMYLSDAVTPALIPAVNYTTRTLPMEIVLKLTFIDMD
jgi:hypothetical protein